MKAAAHIKLVRREGLHQLPFGLISRFEFYEQTDGMQDGIYELKYYCGREPKCVASEHKILHVVFRGLGGGDYSTAFASAFRGSCE